MTNTQNQLGVGDGVIRLFPNVSLINHACKRNTIYLSGGHWLKGTYTQVYRQVFYTPREKFGATKQQKVKKSMVDGECIDFAVTDLRSRLTNVF